MDDARTDAQFWEDAARTIEEANQLPEWKKKYCIDIYGEQPSNVVDTLAAETE